MKTVDWDLISTNLNIACGRCGKPFYRLSVMTDHALACAAPETVCPRVPWISAQRILELATAGVTLTGQALGSTTLHGSLCYAMATVLWVGLTVRQRMWGLMPMNVAGAVVVGWTLWGLMHAG